MLRRDDQNSLAQVFDCLVQVVRFTQLLVALVMFEPLNIVQSVFDRILLHLYYDQNNHHSYEIFTDLHRFKYLHYSAVRGFFRNNASILNLSLVE